MHSTNQDTSIRENLNTIGEPFEYSGIDRNNDEYDHGAMKILTPRVIDDIKQATTNIPQEITHKPIDTHVENNKKSYISKLSRSTPSSRHTIPYSFYVELREYSGRVLTIDQESSMFTAELRNVEDEKEILEAEFEISDVDKGDMGLFRVGALFIWKIGKEQNNGTQQKISQIVFRRLSSWNAIDIKRTEEIAKSRAAAIRAITAEDSATV